MSKLDEIRRDLRTIHQHQSESAAEQMADTLVEHVAFLLAEVDRLTEACLFGLEGHVLCVGTASPPGVSAPRCEVESDRA